MQSLVSKSIGSSDSQESLKEQSFIIAKKHIVGKVTPVLKLCFDKEGSKSLISIHAFVFLGIATMVAPGFLTAKVKGCV
jgi:hypothetical protein